MAAIETPSSGTNPSGGGGGGGGNWPGTPSYSYQSPPVISPPDVIRRETNLAEQVAANLAALGLLNSPLAETQKPSVIVQAPQSNNMLIILLVLGGIILLIWYMKKHGKL